MATFRSLALFLGTLLLGVFDPVRGQVRICKWAGRAFSNPDSPGASIDDVEDLTNVCASNTLKGGGTVVMTIRADVASTLACILQLKHQLYNHASTLLWDSGMLTWWIDPSSVVSNNEVYMSYSASTDTSIRLMISVNAHGVAELWMDVNDVQEQRRFGVTHTLEAGPYDILIGGSDDPVTHNGFNGLIENVWIYDRGVIGTLHMDLECSYQGKKFLGGTGDFEDVPCGVSLGATPLTLAFSVRLDAYGDDLHLVEYAVGDDTDGLQVLVRSDGKVACQWWKADGVMAGEAVTSSAVPLGEWKRFHMVLDATPEIAFQMDGSTVNWITIPSSPALQNVVRTLRVGGDLGNTGKNLIGAIQHLNLFGKEVNNQDAAPYGFGAPEVYFSGRAFDGSAPWTPFPASVFPDVVCFTFFASVAEIGDMTLIDINYGSDFVAVAVDGSTGKMVVKHTTGGGTTAQIETPTAIVPGAIHHCLVTVAATGYMSLWMDDKWVADGNGPVPTGSLLRRTSLGGDRNGGTLMKGYVEELYIFFSPISWDNAWSATTNPGGSSYPSHFRAQRACENVGGERDGSQALELTDCPSSWSSDFSAIFTVRVLNAGVQHILSMVDQTDSNTRWIFAVDATGKLTWEHRIGSDPATVISTPNPVLGQMNRCLVTVSASGLMHFYINGKSVGAAMGTAAADPPPPTTRSVFIGGDASGNFLFTGLIEYIQLHTEKVSWAVAAIDITTTTTTTSASSSTATTSLTVTGTTTFSTTSATSTTSMTSTGTSTTSETSTGTSTMSSTSTTSSTASTTTTASSTTSETSTVTSTTSETSTVTSTTSETSTATSTTSETTSTTSETSTVTSTTSSTSSMTSTTSETMTATSGTTSTTSTTKSTTSATSTGTSTTTGTTTVSSTETLTTTGTVSTTSTVSTSSATSTSRTSLTETSSTHTEVETTTPAARTTSTAATAAESSSLGGGTTTRSPDAGTTASSAGVAATTVEEGGATSSGSQAWSSRSTSNAASGVAAGRLSPNGTVENLETSPYMEATSTSGTATTSSSVTSHGAEAVVVGMHLFGLSAIGSSNMPNTIDAVESGLRAGWLREDARPPSRLYTTLAFSSTALEAETASALLPSAEARALARALQAGKAELARDLQLRLQRLPGVEATVAVEELVIFTRTEDGPVTDPRVFDEEDMINSAEATVAKLLTQLSEGSVDRVSLEVPGATLISTRLSSLSGDGAGLRLELPYDALKQPETVLVQVSSSLHKSLLGTLQAGDELAITATVPKAVTGMGYAKDNERVTVAAAVGLDLNALSGAVVDVSSLDSPIIFTLPANYTKAMICAFWDEGKKLWSTRGVEIHESSRIGSPIVCATYHLSFFGAIVKGILQAVLCNNFSLFNGESLALLFASAWLFDTDGGLFFLVLLLVLSATFAGAAIMDRRRRHMHRWSNEFFLIPISEDAAPAAADEEAEEEGKRQGLVGSVIAACAGFCECCKETALKDALDEIVAEYFEQFSEMRTALEGIWEGLELGALGAGRMLELSRKIMGRLVITSSRRLVGASMGLSERVVSFILEDQELMSVLMNRHVKRMQRESAEHGALAMRGSLAYAQRGDLQDEMVAMNHRMQQEESQRQSGLGFAQDSGNGEERLAPSVFSRERLTAFSSNRDSGSAASGVTGSGLRSTASFSAGSEGSGSAQGGAAAGRPRITRNLSRRSTRLGMQEEEVNWWSCRDREDAWAALHDEICEQMQKHVRDPKWCTIPKMAWDIFVIYNPVGNIVTLNIFMSCKMRALFKMLELMGDILVICVFFASNGNVKGKKQEGESDCEVGEDLEEEIGFKLGRIIAIAFASVLIAGLPVSLLRSFHVRRFKKLPYERCPEWKRQLRTWRTQDKIIWVLGAIYFAFAAFFVALFLANIASDEHEDWTTAGAIGLVQDTIILPLCVALIMPTLAGIAISAVSAMGHVERTSLIRDVHVSVHEHTNVMMPIVCL